MPRFSSWMHWIAAPRCRSGCTLDGTCEPSHSAWPKNADLVSTGQRSRIEGLGLVEILGRYTQTFLWLQRYDEGLLEDPAGQAGGVLASKAAHLLYFVVRIHPFSDGNKRSGAFLFVDFLHRNGRIILCATKTLTQFTRFFASKT